jgi:hypothetical protein
VSENEGEIFLLSQSGSELVPERKTVKLGVMQGKDIEVLETFEPRDEIILNDISNYNPLEQKLERKKK